MKKVLLVQPTILTGNVFLPPSLALGRLSTYFKQKGWDVTLLIAQIEYYNDVTNTFDIDAVDYDKVFVSVVFSYTQCRIFNCDDVEYGGGASINPSKILSPEIEMLPVDYSIFHPHWNDHSFGRLTRGCHRSCKFCDVPITEGPIQFNKSIDDIIQDRNLNDNFKLMLYDNNILKYDDCINLLLDLKERDLNLQFISGFDIRVLTDDQMFIISQLKLIRELRYYDNYFFKYNPKYLFAFDDSRYLKLIESGFKVASKFAPPEEMMFFLYFDERSNSIHDLINRITWCYERGSKPRLSLSFRFKYSVKILNDLNKYLNFFNDPFGKYLNVSASVKNNFFEQLLFFVASYGSELTFDLISDGEIVWPNNRPSIRSWSEQVNFENRDLYLKMLNL